MTKQKSGYGMAQCAAIATALIAVCLAWMLLPVEDVVRAFAEWIRDRELWGILVFALVYVIIVVVLAPASAMSIAAGFIFGAWGIPLVILAAALGANLAFLLSRHVFREKVRVMAVERKWFEAVDQAIKEDGWKIVLLLRLSPLVPFGLQNYVMGVTSISGAAYAVSTSLGIIPGTALYVYLGTLGRVAVGDDSGGALKMTLLVAGLAASALAIFIVGRKAKAKLAAFGVKDN